MTSAIGQAMTLTQSNQDPELSVLCAVKWGRMIFCNSMILFAQRISHAALCATIILGM